ncbi:hypothetical protein AAHB49_08345 [Bacillus cereus]
MFEYGFLTFPALKALEGHLKYVMKENSIPLIEKRFSMFTKEGSSKYILHGDYQAGLDAKKSMQLMMHILSTTRTVIVFFIGLRWIQLFH